MFCWSEETKTYKERVTTEPLNGIERDGGREHVDEGKDERGQEDVLDGTGRLEERSRVVEHKVDTGPLLHHLEGGTEDGAAKIGLGMAETTSEARSPSGEPTALGDVLGLVLGVGDNFSDFPVDVIGIGGLATKAGKNDTSLFNTALLDVPTGRVGKKEETSCEDDTPSELDTDGNTVLARVFTVLDGIVDNSSQHDTDGDAELVARDEGTTNFLGGDFGHVEDDNGRDEADTETGNETTSNNGAKTTILDNLDDATNGVDDATSDDG